jgi:hypothetical protein
MVCSADRRARSVQQKEQTTTARQVSLTHSFLLSLLEAVTLLLYSQVCNTVSKQLCCMAATLQQTTARAGIGMHCLALYGLRSKCWLSRVASVPSRGTISLRAML